MRQHVRAAVCFASGLPMRLVNQMLQVNISGNLITGKIVEVRLNLEASELEISLQLPDDDPTVAAFARAVGTQAMHLSSSGAPQAYEALDELLETNLQKRADPEWDGGWHLGFDATAACARKASRRCGDHA